MTQLTRTLVNKRPNLRIHGVEGSEVTKNTENVLNEITGKKNWYYMKNKCKGHCPEKFIIQCTKVQKKQHWKKKKVSSYKNKCIKITSDPLNRKPGKSEKHGMRDFKSWIK